MPHSTSDLKRKLRQLKQTEIAIRFQGRPPGPGRTLIWDEFFSTGTAPASVKYSLDRLRPMDRDELKSVVEEYFYWVYFKNYAENGLATQDMHDPRLLALLGLPPQAALADIKKRFRELAMKYHPDHGGDSDQFIQLMDVYNRLVDE